ncbi:MOSC domain-containing protein [Kitasatospora sp. NPDC048365]|uniref:MOSC domain-containing protein n=1 Tax=Kitasatospora sp. NPDC048365 TaxID=3364050 RepID=UPI003721CEE4
MPWLTALHVYPLKSARGLDLAQVGAEPWGLAGDRRWMLADPAGRALTQRQNPALARYRALPHPDGSLTVVDPAGESIRVARPSAPTGAAPTLADVFGSRFPALPADSRTEPWFGARLGDVRLLHLADPATGRPVDYDDGRGHASTSMADGYPVLLTTTASLAALNRHIAVDTGDPAVPMDRFRPNLVVSGAEPWAEDTWRAVRVGGLLLRRAESCGRCAMVTVDQATGERRGPAVLRALARHHRSGKKLVFGATFVPVRPAGATGPVLAVLRLGDEVEVVDASDPSGLR